MKDYSKMSDFEINKAVAARIGIEVEIPSVLVGMK